MAGATSAAAGLGGISGLSALSAMNPYTAAISAAVPLAQGIYGIAQKAKANKMRKAYDQPMYNIPGAMDEQYGLAQSLAFDPTLPGQNLIEAGLDRGLATGNRAIMEAGMSGAERLAAINAGVGNRMDSNMQLAVQMAQQQQADIANYQNALNTMAGYQDKRWQLNEQQPWMDAMSAANRLDDAGAQNMMTALKDVSGIGAAAVTGGINVKPPADMQARMPSLVTQPTANRQVENPTDTDQIIASLITGGARMGQSPGIPTTNMSVKDNPTGLKVKASGLDFLAGLGRQAMGGELKWR